MSFYEECIKVVKDELNNFEFGIVTSIILTSIGNKHSECYDYNNKSKRLPNFTHVSYNHLSCSNFYGFEAKIIIKTDELELTKIRKPELYEKIKDHYKFLINSSITLNDNTYFIIALLHEFGHVEYLDKFYHYGSDVFKKVTFQKVYANALQLIFNNKKSGSFYGFKPEEVYADKYAIENFFLIWNKVKHLI